MRYISRYLIAFIASLLFFSPSIVAIELLDANIPVLLKDAYYDRHNAPDTCIEKTQKYIKKQQAFDINPGLIEDQNKPFDKSKALPIQLLAFCYAQIEDYPQAYKLLSELVDKQSFSTEQLRTLNLIALEIPENIRTEYSNQLLIKTFMSSLQKMEATPLVDAPNMEANLLLALSKLSLAVNQYRHANLALETVKDILKNNKNNKTRKLNAWLTYYYGLYYEKINQQQLAISNLLTASKLADRGHLIKLSGEAQKSITSLYQKKHLFNRAIDFAKQRVELYDKTQNMIKQADSLIRLAILKRQNNEINQSIIYLFNALELIQGRNNHLLLAHIYLELGRTYSSSVTSKEHKKERLLAQKYLQNARHYFIQLKETSYQIESLLLLARLNIINEDPALAILQLETVLQQSAGHYPGLRVQAFEMLATSYEITGNHQQAIYHYKNFHSLQNNIKERLFALQQLQINEQLQLVERTQQQRQLEIENNELQNTTEHFKQLTYATSTLLAALLLIFFYILIRNRTLTKSEIRSQRQLTHHPRTMLPSQQAQGNEFNYIYREEPLYYALVNVHFLTRLNELSGIFSGTKLEEKLGEALLKFFTNCAEIFQIRDNQILIISEQKEHSDAQDFVLKIEAFFMKFTDKYQLPGKISVGVVAFPFLNNASRAITPTRMINLSSLALYGASQLAEHYQETCWLELYAIDNLQPAFFDGDLWILGQQAIQKGIIKINNNQPSHQLYWPELDK